MGPIAAETAGIVAAETTAAVGEELVADVEVAVAETETIQAVEAETAEIETALTEEMAAAEGESALSPQTLQEAYDYANTEAKLGHVIDPAKHGFGNLVEAAGGRSEAMKLIVDSLGAGQDLPAAGPFEVTRLVGGEEVTIRGAMVDGVPKIGTAFIRAASSPPAP